MKADARDKLHGGGATPMPLLLIDSVDTGQSVVYVWRDSRQIVSPVRGDVAQALIFPGLVYCM